MIPNAKEWISLVQQTLEVYARSFGEQFALFSRDLCRANYSRIFLTEDLQTVFYLYILSLVRYLIPFEPQRVSAPPAEA